MTRLTRTLSYGIVLACVLGLGAPIGRAAGKDSAAERAQVAAAVEAARKAGGLLMLCGAGLRPPMEALRKEFEKRYKVPVRVVYGGSACLLAQASITSKTKACDLYAPGECYYIEQAAKRGLVEDSANMCYMIPVIMVRDGNPKGIRTPEDLCRSGVRVGLGEAKTCAIGKTTQGIVRKMGLERALAPNVRMHTALAPELGNAIKLGSIDAAINWDAVASWYEDGADVVPMPPARNCVVEVPLGLLTCSKNKKLARLFYDFATGPQGRAIFHQQRYTVDKKQPIYPYKGPR